MVKTPCFHCGVAGFSPWLGKFTYCVEKCIAAKKQNKNKKDP